MRTSSLSPRCPSLPPGAIANHDFEFLQSLTFLKVNSIRLLSFPEPDTQLLTLMGSSNVEGREWSSVYCRSRVRSPIYPSIRPGTTIGPSEVWKVGADQVNLFQIAKEGRRDSMALRLSSRTLLPPKQWPTLSSPLWYGPSQSTDGIMSNGFI